jgi:hypothetical protein
VNEIESKAEVWESKVLLVDVTVSMQSVEVV